MQQKQLQEGKFDDEIVPVEVTHRYVDENNKLARKDSSFSQDEGVRADTTWRRLAKLRPAFSVTGSVTAGNLHKRVMEQRAVMVMDREKAEALGFKPLAKFRSFAVVEFHLK